MRLCRCERPVISPNPRDNEMCLVCVGHLDPRWLSNDQTVKEFFDRLEEALFSLAERSMNPPPARLMNFRYFRAKCEHRERIGRDRFGHGYLRRNNVMEALEEYEDGPLYNFFELLNARRLGRDEEWSVALTAAARAFDAHEITLIQGSHEVAPISPS